MPRIVQPDHAQFEASQPPLPREEVVARPGRANLGAARPWANDRSAVSRCCAEPHKPPPRRVRGVYQLLPAAMNPVAGDSDRGEGGGSLLNVNGFSRCTMDLRRLSSQRRAISSPCSSPAMISMPFRSDQARLAYIHTSPPATVFTLPRARWLCLFIPSLFCHPTSSDRQDEAIHLDFHLEPGSVCYCQPRPGQHVHVPESPR